MGPGSISGANGKAARSPALSYSDSDKSWRISRLDGHLAYAITCDDERPPTDRKWNVYKMGVAPAPKVKSAMTVAGSLRKRGRKALAIEQLSR